MSEPKRYAMSWAIDENEFVYVSPKEQANGNWVKWEEYARLKAAFDLLDESIKLGPSTIPLSRGYYLWKENEQYALKDENARLKSEVERLEKLVGLQESIDKSIDAWIESKKIAAKEGNAK